MLTVERVQNQGPLSLVDPKKFYTCTLQLGARIRWRDKGNGRWEVEAKDPLANPPVTKYRHVPAVHEVGAIPGSVMNGLISAHNDWVVANRKNDAIKGDVSKQLLVSDIEETERPAEEFGNRLTAAVIQEIVSAAVKAALES